MVTMVIVVMSNLSRSQVFMKERHNSGNSCIGSTADNGNNNTSMTVAAVATRKFECGKSGCSLGQERNCNDISRSRSLCKN